MATAAQVEEREFDTGAIMGGLYGDGIIALKGAFPREWARADARGHRTPVRGGAAGARRRPGARAAALVRRGPSRGHPRLRRPRHASRGSSPSARRCSGRTTGSSRSGFDVPVPGARTSPGTATSPRREETLMGRRLNSLAFNLTAVDTGPSMGAVRDRARHAVGRPQRLRARDVPAEVAVPALRARASAKMPQMGDISARSALTIHRGTANRSDESRPVLVLGVDAPDATNAERHDLQVTRGYLESLPAAGSRPSHLPGDGRAEAGDPEPRDRRTARAGILIVIARSEATKQSSGPRTSHGIASLRSQ